MGADRRGPLAAFIVVAIIAAILLVTSVRSQAAPGWFRDPAATVADVPSVQAVWPGPSRHWAAGRPGVVVQHRAERAVASATAATVVRPAPASRPVPARHVPVRDLSVKAVSPRVAHARVVVVPASVPHGLSAVPHVVPHVQPHAVTHVQSHGVPHGRHLGWAGPDHGRHLGWTQSAADRG